MGFYIRKSVSLGPVRFNLSKSGVGMSTGMRGLRWGTGPRGNYVHMGRHGLYFRQSLTPPPNRGTRSTPTETPLVIPPSTVGEFQEIDSGDVLQMQDSSSASLLQELNEKRGRTRLTVWVLIVGVLLTLGMGLLGLRTW